jgi:glycosyltransferase involved in cell wall biosynthesis
MRVLICHPGRQHSHQLAMALGERGMLAKYVTGIPTRLDTGGWLGKRLLRRIAEPYAIPIDPALVQHVLLASLVRRGTRVLNVKASHAVGHLADGLFDRWVCGLVRKLRPDVIVAYENSALCVFRRAKELGVKTVLDAASVHHRWQDRFLGRAEGGWFHRRTMRRKDEEIGLADHILTVSEFARESYLEAGVPSGRVHAIPVGVDSLRFQPGSCSSEARPVDCDFRFVYVGNASHLKGIDVLREAVRRLRSDGARFTVSLIGVSPETSSGDDASGMVRLGWMGHDRLAAVLPRHDVLVLPSLVDSFGMVVAEAMACGLPAIVTENVGTKEMITPEKNGLIVPPGDAAALAEAMRWFIARREKLCQMSRAARESAERYDWTNYRRRVIEFFTAI